MKIILKESLKSSQKAKDFAVNPLNKNIITVGEKLTFFKNNLQETKNIKKKFSNLNLIKYVKEENQLFASSTFYVASNENTIYKCDSSKMNILKIVHKLKPNTMVYNICPSGKIVYIQDKYIYSYNHFDNKLIKKAIDANLEDSVSIFNYNEKIVLKIRKKACNENNITIFMANDLKEISKIKTDTNNTFIKLVGIKLLAAKANGYVEIWDATTSELFDYIKISDHRITFIENDDEWFYFGNSKGELIVTNDNFEILQKIQIFKDEIKKLIYFEDTLYALSENGEIAISILVDDDNLKVIDKFLNTYNIHEDYREFFDIDTVTEIENFIKKLNINKTAYMPKQNLIFRALSTGLKNKKVCILGKDPYFQPNVATGLAFEVKKKTWAEKSINPSLKNILKLIYFSYNNKHEEIDKIRLEIDSGKFKILSPDKLFKSWENQGVLLINTSFTVLVGQAGSHLKVWENFSKKLIKYISTKNENMHFFLWGKDAQDFEKYIVNGKITKHNHPAIAGNLENANDFLNGSSFIETKDIINWLG